jgi:hypothetical protein
MNSVFQSVILNEAQRSEGSILFANINLWILRFARNDKARSRELLHLIAGFNNNGEQSSCLMEPLHFPAGSVQQGLYKGAAALTGPMDGQASSSRLRASRSISRRRISRLMRSSSSGLLSISSLSRDEASSIRSIALSGRNRSEI